MKRNFKWLSVCLIITVLFVTGCGNTTSTDDETQEKEDIQIVETSSIPETTVEIEQTTETNDVTTQEESLSTDTSLVFQGETKEYTLGNIKFSVPADWETEGLSETSDYSQYLFTTGDPNVVLGIYWYSQDFSQLTEEDQTAAARTLAMNMIGDSDGTPSDASLSDGTYVASIITESEDEDEIVTEYCCFVIGERMVMVTAIGYPDSMEWFQDDVSRVLNTVTLNEQGNTNVPESSESDSDNGAGNVESEKEVEIVAEYTFSYSIGWYTYHFMVIRNNTNQTLEVSTSSMAYDADNNILGVDEADFDALGPGCTSVMYEAFEVEGDIDHYDTKLSYEPSRYYESVIQDLSYQESILSNGAVYQVTNNGTKAAEFVEGYALFFKDGELVYYDNHYFTDNDYELKPGETISEQFTVYGIDFDRVEFYLDGRR